MYRMGHLTFGIWISYKKKNLWIFFQKYGFNRKIDLFHLKIKYNIIHMTATAGLTVPHSIAWSKMSIFTEKLSFQMKPIFTSEAMSISKIVAFRAQKNETSSLRSLCTNNEWLGRIMVRWHHSLKEMLGIYLPYEYSWLFLSNSTKYIWQLTKNIAAIVIHTFGIHIQAELIQANLGFR